MEAQMAASAEGNLQGRFLPAGPAMVDHQGVEGQAHLAAPIATQNLLAETAEPEARAPPPVIAAPAQAAGNQRRTAAGAAPKRPLPHTETPGPAQPAPASPFAATTWIQAKGNPLSTAAAESCSSSQRGLKPASRGVIHSPGRSSSRLAEAIRSASSGRWPLYKEMIRAERSWSRGETGSIVQGSTIDRSNLH